MINNQSHNHTKGHDHHIISDGRVSKTMSSGIRIAVNHCIVGTRGLFGTSGQGLSNIQK